MGLYAFDPVALDLLEPGERLEPQVLLERLVAHGHRVGAHEDSGLWLDLRRREDYEEALARYDEIVPLFAAASERPAA
jgi:NDP-sugar pyrophosphorylase family protein